MTVSARKITAFAKLVAGLADTPNLGSTTLLKQWFDSSPEELRVSINGLIDDLIATAAGASGTEQIGSAPISGVAGATAYAQLVDLKNQLTSAVMGSLTDETKSALTQKIGLINGNFDISQRGTSLSLASATAAYLVDRFFTRNITSGASSTASKVAVTDLDGSSYGLQFVHSALPANQGRLHHFYTIEAVDSYKLAGKTVTFSIKVKGVLAMNQVSVFARYNTTEIAISDTSTFISSVSNSIINNATWTTITFTFTCPNRATLTSSGVIGFQITASKTTSEASGDGFIIAQALLNTGSIALPFQPKTSFQEEFDCQRYNYRISSTNTLAIFGSGQANTTTTAQIFVPFSRKMRLVNPTLTTGGTFRLSSGASALAVTAISLNTNSGRSDGVMLDVTVASGLVAGNGCMLLGNSDATAFLNFDCEL